MRVARLTTAHQIGTVLERASGRRLPARVESTRMSLGRYRDKTKMSDNHEKQMGRTWMGTYPPWAAAMGNKCMFGRRRLKAQLP